LQGGHGVVGTGNLDSLFTSTSDPAVPVEFSTHRAPMATMGVTHAGGAMLVSGIVEKGLGESPGVSSQMRTAWGLEWSGLRLIALRGGLSLGGGEGTRLSGGAGLHTGPLHVDVGVASRGITASGSQGVAVSAGALVEI
jgi:hypothetical protein